MNVAENADFPPLECFWYSNANLDAILDAMMEFK